MMDGLRESARGALADALASTPLSQEAQNYVLGAGTYNRPVLTLAVHHMINPSTQVLTPIIAAVEMLHRASVIHDDIQDGDHLRRGAPTAHVVFGVGGALSLADVLLSTAFRLLSPDELQNYLIDAIDLYADMATGQWIDIFGAPPGHSISVTESAAHKSGTLLGCAFKWGARMATTDPVVIGAWHEAGSELGLAFQIMNDIDNALGNEERGNLAARDIAQTRHNSITMQEADKAGVFHLATAVDHARREASDSIIRASRALAPVAAPGMIELLVMSTIGVPNLDWLRAQPHE